MESMMASDRHVATVRKTWIHVRYLTDTSVTIRSSGPLFEHILSTYLSKSETASLPVTLNAVLETLVSLEKMAT